MRDTRLSVDTIGDSADSHEAASRAIERWQTRHSSNVFLRAHELSALLGISEKNARHLLEEQTNVLSVLTAAVVYASPQNDALKSTRKSTTLFF